VVSLVHSSLESSSLLLQYDTLFVYVTAIDTLQCDIPSPRVIRRVTSVLITTIICCAFNVLPLCNVGDVIIDFNNFTSK